jgi:multidrug efflux pump subunit AcrA (membrane-fusion protein)
LPWVVAVLALFMGIGIGSTGSGDQTAELDTASGQVAVLESDLAQAEDQNASLEDSLAEAEASLAEAGESLASGDDAAAALDAREEELNAREDALDEREKALDDREANADSQPDAPAPAPPPPAEDSGSDLTAGQENAIRSAVSYLEMSGFSRSGLIDQLKFEGYTQEQAEYGVTKAGL